MKTFYLFFPLSVISNHIKKELCEDVQGFKNFNGLRNRIIYSLNKDVPIKIDLYYIFCVLNSSPYGELF